MIDSKALLTDLKKQLLLLQADLRGRAEDPVDAWGARLREQHRIATGRGRTGHAWVTWRDGEVDQAAVAWLVATTFVRFCEDNVGGLRAGRLIATSRSSITVGGSCQQDAERPTRPRRTTCPSP